MARGSRKNEAERDDAKAAAVAMWLKEIEASRTRDKDFRADGRKIRELYDSSKAAPFNILMSNTETLLPSLYSQTPRPVISYRFKDENALAKAAALAAQRMLEFSLDTNIEGSETFDECAKGAVLDGLLPGRGVSAVRYDAEVAGDVKGSEMVAPEAVSWDRFFMGYAKKWSKVPWVALLIDIDEAEGKRLFGEKASNLTFDAGIADADKEDKDHSSAKYVGDRKTTPIYKIWDRAGGRQIRYVSPEWTDDFLLVEDDDSGLSSMFPFPRPLQFLEKTDNMVPTALYKLYEQQAEELNELTRRITKITKAIRARGLYDQSLGDDLQALFEEDDAALVPTDKDASIAAEKGLANAIWFLPLDVLITTLRELQAAREQCKQVIYEVTGISDILRGATKASETLGAQQLKSQWGTLRIKPKQAEVQRYTRDMLRLMLEMAAARFSEETWVKMTGLPYATEKEIQQAQAVMQATQQAMQQMPPQAPAGQPGQPPQPQIPPQIQQAMQQAQAVLAKPKWADVLSLLKDDIQRAYKIDIETNSTLEPEAAEDQKNFSDMMMAISQFVQGVAPLVQAGVMPHQVVQSMLLAIVKRFRFGPEIEDYIRNMQPPPQQNEGAQEAQKQVQQLQGQLQQATQQTQQLKQQAAEKGMQDQATIQQLRTENQALQKSAELDKRSTDLDVREIKLQTDEQLFKIEQQKAQESIANKSAIETNKIESKKQISALQEKQGAAAQQKGKEVSQKVDGSMQTFERMIAELAKLQVNMAQSVQQTSEMMAEVLKTVKAPRKRTAQRDKEGNLIGVTDEVMN